MRKMVLTCVAALAVAAPAYAGGGGEGGEEHAEKQKPRELRIAGSIVRLSQDAVAVENRVGDAVLTCLVPDRLSEKVAAFEVGEKVRMHCLRHRGRRAVLVKLRPLEHGKRPEKPAVEKQQAAGPIVELDEGAIVVQSSEGRLACRVPEEKQAKLDALKLGEKVKIWCADGVLAGLERYAPAGEEVRIYGQIAELSHEAVTVRGEAGSLSCRVPAALAQKLAGFAVGDSVKMICRGAELVYLEKRA
jgi:hypothetical protein